MTAPRLGTVMYVDDEPDIREIVELSLGLSPGLRVITCGSGEDAIATALERRPDLILLDVMMPGLDGPATLARLRADAALQDIPVVFLTAKALPAEIRRFIDLGAAAVIAKPFDALSLATQVQDIWETLDHDR